jgi:hypothetical protein
MDNKVKYRIKLSKYLKDTAIHNKKLLVTIKINKKYKKILYNLIDTHNDLLTKFINLYNKFMDLVFYIKETSPNILKTVTDIEKYNITDIKAKNKEKLELELFDRDIVVYLSEKDRHLLEDYINKRNVELYDKINRLLGLIDKLNILTIKLKKEILNL